MQSSWSWPIMCAPGLNSPMTRKGTLRMRIIFTGGRFVVEQFVFHGVADHADTVDRVDVLVGEEGAFLQVLPIARGQVARPRPRSVCGTQLRPP